MFPIPLSAPDRPGRVRMRPLSGRLWSAARRGGVLLGAWLLAGLLAGVLIAGVLFGGMGIESIGTGEALAQDDSRAANTQAANTQAANTKDTDAHSGQPDTGQPEIGAPLEFCVVLPGLAEPDLPEAVADLAAYLEQMLGRPVRGTLLDPPPDHGSNQGPDPGLAWISEHRPAFGLVDLSFYVQYARSLAMTPLAASRPGGFDTDQWRLMVRPEDQDRPLSGVLRGSMLFFQRAGACILLAGTTGGLVRPQGAARPLDALRELLAGQGAAVALDRLQYQAVRGLPQFRGLAEVHATGELPMPPLVWFGPLPKDVGQSGAGHPSQAVAQAFLSMADDPRALALLRALGIQSFGPPDPGLAPLLKSCPE